MGTPLQTAGVTRGRAVVADLERSVVGADQYCTHLTRAAVRTSSYCESDAQEEGVPAGTHARRRSSDGIDGTYTTYRFSAR